MSDRSSQAIFATAFQELARMLPKGPKRQAYAAKLWDLTQDYDFSPDDLTCTLELVALGLLTWGPADKRYPEDGPSKIWKKYGKR